LYFSTGAPVSARRFCMTFGLVYFALGVLGFVAPNLVLRLLDHPATSDAGMLAADNLVHLVLGAAFLIASVYRADVAQLRSRRA
jgi:hypothetical protein